MNFIIENFKNPKTILIVLGLTTVIVSSVMLVGYGSYLSGLIVGPGTPVCTENDGGKNYYQKGTITLSDGTKLTDYCMTGGYKDNVMEYYCATNGHGMTNFKCPNGCVNGACVRGTTPPPPVCTDSDGGINVMKKGTAKDNSGSYTDYCVGNSIVEYFCHNGVAKRASDSPSGYLCSRYGQNMICDNGACKEGEPEATCEADGKCKTSGCPTGDPDCSCTEQGGNICQTDEICPEVSLKHKDSGICCPVSCIPEAIYSISGQITTSENISVSGISMNLTGTSSVSTATNSDGNYSFINLANGSYIVTPSDDIWTFSPTSQNVTVSSNNAIGINFTGIPDLCKQYFEVQDENSVPIAGAAISTQGAFPEISGGPACDTDNNGRCYIQFRRIEKNHTAEAKKDGYECYNNECRRTFDGCLTEAIVLKLKKPAAVYQTADLNCDGSVNLTDSAILMSFWGKDPSQFTSCQSPDINQNGAVNLADSAIMMSQWTEMTL